MAHSVLPPTAKGSTAEKRNSVYHQQNIVVLHHRQKDNPSRFTIPSTGNKLPSDSLLPPSGKKIPSILDTARQVPATMDTRRKGPARRLDTAQTIPSVLDTTKGGGCSIYIFSSEGSTGSSSRKPTYAGGRVYRECLPPCQHPHVYQADITLIVAEQMHELCRQC